MNPLRTSFLLPFICLVVVAGCKNDPNADARQAARNRLAAGKGFRNMPAPPPGMAYVNGHLVQIHHEPDTFAVSFPRDLTPVEKKLVGIWEGNGLSRFSEGPEPYQLQFYADGSYELSLSGKLRHDWNGGSKTPWQVDSDGVLWLPKDHYGYTYTVKGNRLTLISQIEPKYRRTMILSRKDRP